MNKNILSLVEEVVTQCGLSLRRVTGALDIPRATHYRKRHRFRNNAPIVNPPGPQKMVTADIAALSGEISFLDHKTRATYGAPALVLRHTLSISRRDFMALVHNHRICEVSDHRDGLYDVTWKHAGLVWSMDDTLYKYPDANGDPLWIHHVRDIGAHYSFQPISGPSLLRGTEVGANILSIAKKNVASIFLKRDNGANLNTPDVDDALAELCIIPFNSPVAMPTYNGAMERSQGTLKAELEIQLGTVPIWYSDSVEPFVRAAAHAINHSPLPTFGDSTACFYRATNQVQFTKSERKRIYETVYMMRDTILEGTGNTLSPKVALRRAIVIWLKRNELISINRHRECYPV